MKIIIQFLLLFFCRACFAQYGFDTVTIYFPIDKHILDNAALKRLDSLSGIIQVNGQKIMIFGYADYLGKEDPNQELSESRAQATQEYLLSKGVRKDNILSCTGVGQIKELSQNGHGNQLNRRTDIYVKRLKPLTPPYQEAVKQLKDEKQPPSHIAQQIADLDTGDVMVLNNINFYPSSHQPLEESLPVLMDLVTTMKQVPTLSIKIEGHICCIKDMDDALDTETGDRNLSTARAKFIYAFLIKNGIKRERLRYEGFGRKRPLIEDEKTEEDAKANRRVEIRILSK